MMVTKRFDNTAEANIIGGLALYPEDTEYVFNELISEDFEDVRLGEIYDVIKKISADGKPIDVALVCSKFKTPEYKVVLAKCAEIFITLSNYSDYIQTVKTKAQERRLRRISEDIFINATSGSDILSIMQETIERESQIIDNKKYDKHYINQYSEYVNSKQSIVDGYKPDTFNFGLSRVDNHTAGLKRSTISTVGALPTTGKTDLAIQAMVTNCFAGYKTMAFTIEMSEGQFLDRVSAQISDVDYGKISKNEIDEDDLGKISRSMATFYQNKPLIFDNTNTVETIEKIICDNKPDFVLIDYLQIMSIQKRCQNRNLEIGEIGNILKKVAKQCDCHIMLLSQLKRIAGNKPTMQDLRDSGCIEQQSDYIMLIHRPYVTNKESSPPSETELIIDKNKYGKCGISYLRFDGDKQRFYTDESKYS